MMPYKQKIKNGKDRFIALIAAFFICLLPLTACSTAEESGLYDKAARFVGILWNVDYRTFSADETTAFAKANYAEDYLASYLEDIEGNAGAESARENKLISRVLWTEDGGSRVETIEDVAYTIERVRARIEIDSYRPADPGMSYYEEGEAYTMLYDVYFREENGAQRIAQFGFEPEEGEFLPAGENQALDSEGRERIGDIARSYLTMRYNISYDSFDKEALLKFYEGSLSPDFCARDGLDAEGIAAQEAELIEYNVTVTLEQSETAIGEQKKYASDGEKTGFYYWADVKYIYSVKADEAFYALKGVYESNAACERLYFSEKDGVYTLEFAEYTEAEE